MKVNYKILSLVVLVLFSACSHQEPEKTVLDDILYLEIKEVSRNLVNVEFEVLIKNISKEKISISTEGEQFETASVSVLDIGGKTFVVKDFPTSFSIDAGKEISHRFSLNITDLDEKTDLGRYKFYLGVIRWKIGKDSRWQENPESVCLETKS